MNNKKLFRSTTNRMVCGVCGGLGDFFGIDATVIRIFIILWKIMMVSRLIPLITMFTTQVTAIS